MPYFDFKWLRFYIYISILTIFLYESCIIAIFKYSGPSYLENYARVIVFEPDLYRLSFYNVIDFLSYSTS